MAVPKYWSFDSTLGPPTFDATLGFDMSTIQSQSAGKAAVPKTFLRPVIGGKRYSRNPDTTASSTPSLKIPTSDVSNAYISWVNGIDPDSGIQNTLAQISPSGLNTWTTISIDYPGTAAKFPGLTGATPYDIRIANTNGAGLISLYSPIQTVTTLGSNPALEPGQFDIVPTSIVSASSGQPISIAVTRTGAGGSSPAVSVDWNITGVTSGVPVPANGTLNWPAGQNSTQYIQTVAGTATSISTGTVNLLNAIAASGSLNPSIGNAGIGLQILPAPAAGKKWAPGMWAASDNYTFTDDSKRTNQLSEFNKVAASTRVVGILEYYLMGIIGNTRGSKDFSKIFRDRNLLATYSPQRHLMVNFQPQLYNSTNVSQILPTYISGDSTYGQSPTTGSYGWWSINGGSGVSVAFWRPLVMDWVIEVFTAFLAATNGGVTTENDPLIDAIMFGETSVGVDTSCPDYSEAAGQAQFIRLVDAMQSVSVKTIHAVQNNYSAASDPSRTLGNQLAAECIAKGSFCGGPDTVVGKLSAPMKYVLGQASGDPLYTGFPDLRGVAGQLYQTQDVDLYAAKTGPQTPISIFNFVNDTLRQAHWIVAMINIGASNEPVPAYPGTGKNTGVNPGNWFSALEVINGNSLTHIQKPSSIT